MSSPARNARAVDVMLFLSFSSLGEPSAIVPQLAQDTLKCAWRPGEVLFYSLYTGYGTSEQNTCGEVVAQPFGPSLLRQNGETTRATGRHEGTARPLRLPKFAVALGVAG